jgi:hypothetical protein
MNAVTEPAKVGRPTVMSKDVQDRLIELIGSGVPNTDACVDVGIDQKTLYNTLQRDPEFFQRYDLAKKATVDALVDRARTVARGAMAATNGAQVQAAKLMWDHEWREAQRLAPQRWGEKAQVELTGRIESSDPAEISKRLAFIEMLGAAQLGGDVTDATAEDDDDTDVGQ